MSESDHPHLLSATQRRLLGFSLSFFALVGSATLLVFVLYVFGRLVGFFSDVLWPLAVAGVLALILRPVVDLLEARLKGKRTAAVSVLYLAFVLLASGLLIAIIPPLAEQLIDLIAYAPSLWSRIVAHVKIHYPQWIALWDRIHSAPMVEGLLSTAQEELGKLPSLLLPSLKAASEGIFTAFGFITHLAIVPIYLFFFLLVQRDPTENFGKHLAFLKESVRYDIIFLIREFVSIVESFFRGQILIGLAMGIMLAIGFTAVGLKFGLIIGLLLGVLNIIPYLGTIIGLAVALPLAFFQPDGGIRLLCLVLAVKGIVQAIEGWYLTPKIMGERTGLHPVTIIVAIFFWGRAFGGVFGMILAIPLTAFFVTAWRLARKKYFTAK